MKRRISSSKVLWLLVLLTAISLLFIPWNPLTPIPTSADGQIAITDRNPSTRVITFIVGALPTGTYNITLYTPHCLVNLKNGVDIAAQGTSIDMGSLKEGDDKDITEGSKTIDITDFTRFAAAYETTPTSQNWNEKADSDRNGSVDINDFSLLYTNYGKSSPQIVTDEA